jgi:hypothetical protein
MRNTRLLLAFLLLPLLAQPAPSADPTPADVRITATKKHIDFRAGKALVARYVIDPKARKPYFWPLNAPSGEGLTANGPSDHVHHRSAWFCHGDVIPEGMELKHKVRGVKGVDFWSEDKNAGRIVCTGVSPVKVKKNHGRVTTHNEWRTAGGKKVLDEKRTIHLYDLGTSRLLVLDIDLHASVVPLTFGDTKEGSLGVRVRRTVQVAKPGKGKLTNAEGKSGDGGPFNLARKGCWGLVSAWCDYSGPVGDGVAGVAIFADPTNKVPTAWHARNYGLMAANPFGRRKSGFPDTRARELVKLAKGAHLKFRYGLYLHGGDTKEGKVAQAYKRFVKLKGEKERRAAKVSPRP